MSVDSFVLQYLTSYWITTLITQKKDLGINLYIFYYI
jgi:hypothetical protein